MRLAHLLLLMGDVLALAGLAHAVALDRLGEDDGRLALGVDRLVIGRIDLACGSWPPRVSAQISSSLMSATIAFSSGYLPKKCSRT